MNNNTLPKNKILIAEDDRNLNEQLTELFSEAGYDIDTCFTGDDALLMASKKKYQLMLLDLMLPGKCGLSVLRTLRKSSQVPVIIVSAKGAEEERITGLRQGADDYISKPFNSTELLLRAEALLRRIQSSTNPTQSAVVIDDLQLNFSCQQATVRTSPMELTSIQFKLLWQLGLHHGEVVSKAYLSQQVLSRTLGAYDRSLDMHLSRLRRKLSEAGWSGERLKTVHGKGYCLQ